MMALQKIHLWRFVFVRCFLISFVGISVSYFLLIAIFGRSPIGPPFYIFMKIIAYWDTHPLQYIGVVCFCYAVLSASWTIFFGRSKSWSRMVQIVGVLVASIIVSSFSCGMLWSIHDMQAGYFPSWFMEKMWTDGKNGLFLGPRMINNSFPLNLIALALGYIIANQVSNNGNKALRPTASKP